MRTAPNSCARPQPRSCRMHGRLAQARVVSPSAPRTRRPFTKPPYRPSAPPSLRGALPFHAQGRHRPERPLPRRIRVRRGRPPRDSAKPDPPEQPTDPASEHVAPKVSSNFRLMCLSRPRPCRAAAAASSAGPRRIPGVAERDRVPAAGLVRPTPGVPGRRPPPGRVPPDPALHRRAAPIAVATAYPDVATIGSGCLASPPPWREGRAPKATAPARS